MQHYLHQYFKYSTKYSKIINSNSIYFSWRFFFLNFFYSINHKMILESFLFFNIYVTAMMFTYMFIPTEGISQIEVVKTYSYAVLVAHIINSFLFYHLYQNRINYYISKNQTTEKVDEKIRPLGFNYISGNFELYAFVNTTVVFLATNIFLLFCYLYLKFAYLIYSIFS